jgi:Fe-S oxidoreductase
MYGAPIVRAFEAIKDSFDPEGIFNPGKIVRPPRMDDRRLMRFPEGYATPPVETALDWSAWGGLPGATEMCNNNGECRKFDAGTMCPSYRVTRDEAHVVRGRANTLRLALSGQLGAAGLASDEVAAAMELCVGCKACRRECPTGVDMARMKIEADAARAKRRGVSRRGRLIASLPRWAPWASRLAPLANLRNRIPALARLGERWLGIAASRKLPEWSRDPFIDPPARAAPEAILFVDSFTRWFEPENARAALAVFAKLGIGVSVATADRPLCCGRTWLSEGLVEAARAEQRRLIDTLLPHARAGLPIIGLEPSCLFTLKDELAAVIPGEEARSIGARTMLFEEFLVAAHRAGRIDATAFAPLPQKSALLHGHCHQKAFGAMGAVEAALRLVPGLEVGTVAAGCCGMAGSFGYEAEHRDLSLAMGELALLPAMRAAAPDTLLVADGTSCRAQIRDGAAREAVHVALVLERSLSR